MLIKKDEFLKKFKEEERRAYEIIKTLKSRNKSNTSYILKREIHLINSIPTIKIIIKELPVVRIGDKYLSTDTDEYYNEQEIENTD